MIGTLVFFESHAFTRRDVACFSAEGLYMTLYFDTGVSNLRATISW